MQTLVSEMGRGFLLCLAVDGALWKIGVSKTVIS